MQPTPPDNNSMNRRRIGCLLAVWFYLWRTRRGDSLFTENWRRSLLSSPAGAAQSCTNDCIGLYGADQSRQQNRHNFSQPRFSSHPFTVKLQELRTYHLFIISNWVLIHGESSILPHWYISTENAKVLSILKYWTCNLLCVFRYRPTKFVLFTLCQFSKNIYHIVYRV